MLQYNVYVNGKHEHTLSEQEYVAMRADIRRDYRTWLAAGCSLIGCLMSGLNGVVKAAGTMGGALFVAALIAAPHWLEDFMNSTPKELASGMSVLGLGILLIGGLGMVLGLLPNVVSSTPSMFYVELCERIKARYSINAFSAFALEAVVLPDPLQQQELK